MIEIESAKRSICGLLRCGSGCGLAEKCGFGRCEILQSDLSAFACWHRVALQSTGIALELGMRAEMDSICFVAEMS